MRGLRSIVHGFVSLEMTGGFGMPVGLDASFNWLIRTFIAGLHGPAGIDELQETGAGN